MPVPTAIRGSKGQAAEKSTKDGCYSSSDLRWSGPKLVQAWQRQTSYNPVKMYKYAFILMYLKNYK